MNVGILYICTGAYSVFWDEFYLSAKKFLFPQVKKTFFLFTEKTDLPYTEQEDVIKIDIEHKEWPYSTLLRFDIFEKYKSFFAGYDFLLFFNANTLFVDKIAAEELLPLQEDTPFVALCNGDIIEYKNEVDYTYDRNPLSKAYIPYGKEKKYFRGGLNGGRKTEFIELIEECNRNTKIDLKAGVIALWHDESHLNKYLLDKSVKILYSQYGKPEEWLEPQNAKIIFVDKQKILGKKKLNNIKGYKNAYSLTRFYKKMKRKILR